MDRDWFEMKPIRNRHFENSVWVPLRQSDRNEFGPYNQAGHQMEFRAAGSVLIPLSLREQGEKLSWLLAAVDELLSEDRSEGVEVH